MTSIDLFHRRMLELGRGMERPLVEASIALCAELPRDGSDAAEIALDQAYGPDARHRLDVFHAPGESGRPVFLFVHGGGFIGGDKNAAGGYAYANIGQWAVRRGMVGINMTYRLAPAHPWPAASDDVQAAVEWVIANAARFGGDPGRVFLCGHSAGAAHVASYLARTAEAGQPARVAGAIVMSGVYDVAAMGLRPNVLAYYGDDASLHASRSTIEAVAKTSVPLLVAVAEEDPDGFQRDALQLVSRYAQVQGRLPGFVVAQGHNHFTESYHLGSIDTRLGDILAGFVRQNG